MTPPSFVAWVKPIAAALREDRAELIAFARDAAPAFWLENSTVDGWSNKDILAHLAGGNDQLVQIVLRSLVNRSPVDAAMLAPDTDAANAHKVAERRVWSVDDLIVELNRDGEEVIDLLSRLTEDDRDARPDGLGATVGAFLALVQRERHDVLHLNQLREGSHAR